MKWEPCSVCKGFCCKINGGGCISDTEVTRIENEVGHKINVVHIDGRLYKMVGKDGGNVCQFLNDTGCTLKQKPLGCAIYPFMPTSKGWVVRTHCKYWYRADNVFFAYAKQYFKIHCGDWVDVYIKE